MRTKLYTVHTPSGDIAYIFDKSDNGDLKFLETEFVPNPQYAPNVTTLPDGRAIHPVDLPDVSVQLNTDPSLLWQDAQLRIAEYSAKPVG